MPLALSEMAKLWANIAKVICFVLFDEYQYRKRRADGQIDRVMAG